MAAVLPMPASAQDATVALPGGQPASILETLAEEGGVYRLRLVVPALADLVGAPADLSAAMDMACTDIALPALADAAPAPARIVVSMSEIPTEFGIANPGVLQVFEAYTVDGDRCIWEPF
ncbi:hypothetical protein RISW2_23555 [Roseivivax isoporae LMG 25204]|uniref:Acetolactate synthase n=2 Tax=Roseivivax TaxID=93682 RepID=X7FBS6_9RHOB|nr:hypothetical protein RISW2_23555 [Roseivivax isoporae LMG 25204]